MISLDELYEVVKTASAPAAPAPQDTPGGQAMAAAAKMAAPPGAPPMPQPIEQPEQAAAGDPTAEQQKHLADIAKKDKEINDLRTKTQELALDVKRMQMTSELQKQQQAMLDKVRNEQKLLDKKQTEFTSAEATHKANLEKETARHEVMRAKADAKSLAEIAHRDADSIKANAEQNAKNYVKMVEDARKTTDSYMASKEKAFAQTQEAAKKNSPYISVALRSNVDGALAAAKNIGKLRSRIAKDDIKFNKVASQGSAKTNLNNDGSATNLGTGSAPVKDTKAELAEEEAAANSANFNEAIDNMAEMISNRGTTLSDANQERQRLAGYNRRADVNSDRVRLLAARRAQDKANNEYAAREQRVNDILSGRVAATNAERNEAQKQKGIVTMSDKSYGGWYTSNDIESDNKKMQDAGFHNTTLGQWNQTNAAAEARKQQNKGFWGHAWDFTKGMTWGLVTGIGDAAMNAQRGADAAKAFGVERGMMGAKGKNGINTKAFEEYANAHGLSQGWGKDALNIAGNTALAAVSAIPAAGAVGALARGAKGAVTAARAATGINRATQAASALGKGTWNATKTMFGGSNAKMLGRYGVNAANIGKKMDIARGALIAPMLPGAVDALAGMAGVHTNLSGHTAPITEPVTNALYGQGINPFGQAQDNIGSYNEIVQHNMMQRQESNPYSVIGQNVRSASAKVTDPFTKYASVLGAYQWKDNPELEFLKNQSRNVYNSTTAGRAASFLSPFISSATGGRLKIAPDYQLPVNTPKPLDVERAISDFHSQHWRSKFNPDANKYPTPMMGHTLRQFQAAQKAKGDPWTYEYNHSILGGMSSPNGANKLNKLLSLVHDLD